MTAVKDSIVFFGLPMRVYYMVKDLLEVGVALAIIPSIFIPQGIMEPLLLQAKIH